MRVVWNFSRSIVIGIFFGLYIIVIALCAWKMESISSMPIMARIFGGAHSLSQNAQQAGQRLDGYRSQTVQTRYRNDSISWRVENKINRSIEYGSPLSSGKRTPIVMIRSVLLGTIHDRLLSFPMFSCAESALNHMGLDKRVKPPVYIFEGYFHTMNTNGQFYSKNPNPEIGIDFMKPAAGDLMRAFHEAFRQINRGVFVKLQSDLIASAMKRSPLSPEKDVCFIFATWIRQGRLFGDLSIQIHYGRGNEANFARAWHVDAENSLLHLAITLRGNRTLHSRRRSSPEGPTNEVCETQRAGDVYLSSSALMLHAPKFADTTYDSRVIATHARILYTSAELKAFREARTDKGWECLTSILANNLASADVRVPDIQDLEKFLPLPKTENS